MPELPEIEHLRATLAPRLAGRRVVSVRLARSDVHRNDGRRRGRPDRLLRGATIRSLLRHGKQLALLAGDGRVLCVHLGMSGQLRWLAPGGRLADAAHVHCTWTVEGSGGGSRERLVFRDPRRFGGLWTFPTLERLRRDRWGRLGPDALGVAAADLARRLAETRRSVKAALLDQELLAGLGNIYVDEALFAAGIHPASPAAAIPPDRARRLAPVIRPILRRAIRAGGTTLRDYLDGEGRSGAAGRGLAVYGRGGAPCRVCGRPLETLVLAQRTTVACRRCQPLFR